MLTVISIPFPFAKGIFYCKIAREDCILFFQKQHAESGIFPKKGDFSPEIVACIKSYFGPWPHALEEAGIKESKKEERLQKNLEKHIKAKIKRRNAKIKKSEV